MLIKKSAIKRLKNLKLKKRFQFYCVDLQSELSRYER